MSELFDPLFGDPDLTEPLSDRARIQAMLDVEAALALASARVGLTPVAAVAPIRHAAAVEYYDLTAIGQGAAKAGNLAIPLVAALTERVRQADPEAARWVHWGATSQDIIDTGLALQLQRAVPVVVMRLEQAARAAAGLAQRHARTPMAGRTWLQHATPITFGLRAAGWCDALSRAATRLAASLDEAAVLQLGGASGNLAGFGREGLRLADELGRELGLQVPEAPWHTQRDRLAELAAALGIGAGVGGKIGRDIGLMAQTEVSEAGEAKPGTSSAMPQKRNPVGASVAIAAALRAPGLVATILAAMPQEQERGLGGWQAEWETLPDLIRIAGGGARAIATTLESLAIDPGRMRANLGLTEGQISTEAVALALGALIGRSKAHAIVARAVDRAVAEARDLAGVLHDDPEISAHYSPQEVAALLDPERALGLAEGLVDRVLARFRTVHG